MPLRRLQERRCKMPLVPSSNTLIITSYPMHWGELAKYTCASHKRYCNVNGFDYHADRSQLFDKWYNPLTSQFEQLPIKGFVKLDLFLRFLPHYKTIVWLDADLVVTNDAVRMDEVLGSYTDLALPYDFNGHNATVIIARSTDRIRQFFWACNNTGRKFFLKHDWAEMEAMRYFLQTPPYAGMAGYHSIKRLCALKIDEYEPYVPASVSGEYAWEPGDFAVHLSALTLERRIELAKFYTENH